MRIIVLLVMVLVAAAALPWPVWAQAPEKADTEKPAAAPVTSAKAPKAQKVRKATAARRQQDARHCLQRPNNDAIIRCAEEYL